MIVRLATVKHRCAAALIVLLCGFVHPCNAAEITDVIDAFDGEKKWDGIFGVRYVHINRQSLVLREWTCIAPNPLCPNGSAVLDTRQMAFSESLNVLNLDFRAGVYQDFELYMTLPVVVGWTSDLQHDTGVSGSNSLVDSSLITSLFSLPYQGPSRVGLGDLVLGAKYAPFHQSRDSAYPSWIIGLEYLAPTGEVRTANQTGVGGAVHALSIITALSRSFGVLEPYLEFRGILRFANPSGPFKNERITQTLVSPGHSLSLLLGSEFHLWNRPSEANPYLTLDIGLMADYTFEGREFTELFDALGSSDCNPAEGCSRTFYTRDLANGQQRKVNGITDVENYGRLGAKLGLNYRPMKHLKVRFGFDYWHTTSHYITFADAGVDIDGVGGVRGRNTQSLNEFNPFYNSSYDEYGRRFRVDDKHTYRVTIAIEGQL